MLRIAKIAAIGLGLLVGGCSEEKVSARRVDGAVGREAKAPEFDFYVLALSWSPSYCAIAGARADRQQCEARTPHGFVVHGLWPQFEGGSPEYCDTGERSVPSRIADDLIDIMPSRSLVNHQWRKHGSCSGLSRDDYFNATRAARERIRIPAAFSNPARAQRLAPDALEDAFRASNPGLRRDAIAVSCDGEIIREVRICFDTDLEFRACPEIDRRGCRSGQRLMPGAG